jgi:hypothetical protein
VSTWVPFLRSVTHPKARLLRSVTCAGTGAAVRVSSSLPSGHLKFCPVALRRSRGWRSHSAMP